MSDPDDKVFPDAAQARRARGEAQFRDTMFRAPVPGSLCRDVASTEFAFGEIWSRPGLDRRARRWISLACAGMAGVPVAVESHVYAALKSGDVSLIEMDEFILHFTLYAGLPKASVIDGAFTAAKQRLAAEGDI